MTIKTYTSQEFARDESSAKKPTESADDLMHLENYYSTQIQINTLSLLDVMESIHCEPHNAIDLEIFPLKIVTNPADFGE